MPFKPQGRSEEEGKGWGEAQAQGKVVSLPLLCQGSLEVLREDPGQEKGHENGRVKLKRENPRVRELCISREHLSSSLRPLEGWRAARC